MPIILSNGAFFGTLCAIDPQPARARAPETIAMFKLFAELIAFHLDATEQLFFGSCEERTRGFVWKAAARDIAGDADFSRLFPEHMPVLDFADPLELAEPRIQIGAARHNREIEEAGAQRPIVLVPFEGGSVIVSPGVAGIIE